MKSTRLPKNRILLILLLLGIIIVFIVACWSSDQQTRQDRVKISSIDQTQIWPVTDAPGSVKVWLDDDPTQQIIILGDAVSVRSTPGFEFHILTNPRIRIMPIGDRVIIPAAPVCYFTPGDELPEIASPFSESIIAARNLRFPGNAVQTAWCLDDRPYLPGVRASWQNEIALLDYNIDGDFAPANNLQITFRWLYTEAAQSMGTYHISNYLLFEGETIAQTGDISVPAWSWYEGDMLITHFTLKLPVELPDGDYALVTGFYAYPSLEHILLNSGDTHRTVESWHLGPKEPQKIIDPTLDVY